MAIPLQWFHYPFPALNNPDASSLQAHILAGWCLELNRFKLPSVSFITIQHRPQQKTVSLLLCDVTTYARMCLAYIA
jgi:hypothetical protein